MSALQQNPPLNGRVPDRAVEKDTLFWLYVKKTKRGVFKVKKEEVKEVFMLTQKNDAKLEDTMNKIQLIRNNIGTRDNILQILPVGVIYS